MVTPIYFRIKYPTHTGKYIHFGISEFKNDADHMENSDDIVIPEQHISVSYMGVHPSCITPKILTTENPDGFTRLELVKSIISEFQEKCNDKDLRDFVLWKIEYNSDKNEIKTFIDT